MSLITLPEIGEVVEARKGQSYVALAGRVIAVGKDGMSEPSDGGPLVGRILVETQDGERFWASYRDRDGSWVGTR